MMIKFFFHERCSYSRLWALTNHDEDLCIRRDFYDSSWICLWALMKLKMGSALCATLARICMVYWYRTENFFYYMIFDNQSCIIIIIIIIIIIHLISRLGNIISIRISSRQVNSLRKKGWTSPTIIDIKLFDKETFRGVIVDEILNKSIGAHVRENRKHYSLKWHDILGIFINLKANFQYRQRNQIYHIFVDSHNINFCSLVWGFSAQSNIESLHKRKVWEP